ncbi:phasin family protein [Desulfuromonas thiophila]|uniref:Polyhydroxyalkanoate synthesis regulator phasin n=1 Tax=Desulfuromonas thiophila TaxID=57664 RepID=A0A1G7D7D4_9BACT|nr:phasin family protein [Desulfuromonas thiophila]SDE47548.1 hypothetical protein SAMN05661003_11254 [Desulfuromonas thiophila]
MFEILEKTLLTALGAASLTQKKTEELACELRQRFNLSEEEGKKLVTSVQEAVKQRQQDLQDAARDEVRQAAERLGLVPRSELEALEQRVRQLEERLGQN